MALEGPSQLSQLVSREGGRLPGLRAHGVQHPLHQALKWGGLIPQLHSSPQGYLSKA